MDEQHPIRRPSAATAATIEVIAEAFESIADRISRVLERDPDMAEEAHLELAGLVRFLKAGAADGVARAEGYR